MKSAEPWQIPLKRLSYFIIPAREPPVQRAKSKLPPPLSSGLLPAASHYVCRDQREGEGGDEGREKNKQWRGKCLPSYRVFTSCLRKSGEKRGRIRRDKIEKEGANIPTELFPQMWQMIKF